MKIKEIKEFIDKSLNIDIANKSREFDYIKGRMVYYFLCFRYSSEKTTYKGVGELVYKNHASVVHGLKKFREYYDTDYNFKAFVSELQKEITLIVPEKVMLEIIKIDDMEVLDLKKNLRNARKRNARLYNKIENLKYQLKKAS